jgi:hypothetical protein
MTTPTQPAVSTIIALCKQSNFVYLGLEAGTLFRKHSDFAALVKPDSVMKIPGALGPTLVPKASDIPGVICQIDKASIVITPAITSRDVAYVSDTAIEDFASVPSPQQKPLQWVLG